MYSSKPILRNFVIVRKAFTLKLVCLFGTSEVSFVLHLSIEAEKSQKNNKTD